MKIQVGFDNTIYGDLVLDGDEIEIEPSVDGAGDVIGRFVDWYAESLAFDGVKPEAITPKMILETMVDRMTGRTWAKVIEP